MSSAGIQTRITMTKATCNVTCSSSCSISPAPALYNLWFQGLFKGWLTLTQGGQECMTPGRRWESVSELLHLPLTLC